MVHTVASGSGRSRRLRRPWLWVVGIALLAVLACGLYLAVSLRGLQPKIEALRADAATFEAQLRAGDLGAAAQTMTALRTGAGDVDATVGNPIWGLAGRLPMVGDDVSAVRTVARVAESVTSAVRPMEGALPALSADGFRANGGAVDTAALQQISDAVPEVSVAVTDAVAALDEIDVGGLRPDIADAVTSLREPLAGADAPLATARRALPVLPQLLGSDRPRRYFVLLEQGAEARGTGGFLGAYALVTADRGKLMLERASPRGELDGRAIPSGVLPEEVQDLWGVDFTEWAGLNLSPHFPWTGELVAAGWAARPGEPAIDGVLALDAHVVSALLAGTGPVTVDGLTMDATNAVDVLSREIYARYEDPNDVDAVTSQIVGAAFGKLATGSIDLPALVGAMKSPYAQRRLLLWSPDRTEQGVLETLSLGGALPAEPGPVVMAVVNNGGGNKMDAYLKVDTAYDGGTCSQGVRIGRVSVTLTNTAPAQGLPEYVDTRTDKIEAGEDFVRGSNRILLDLYSSIGSQVPVASVGEEDQPILVQGLDRNLTVTRVVVELDPGQSRTVDFTLVDPAVAGVAPRVLAQPMVLPVSTTVAQLTPCS